MECPFVLNASLFLRHCSRIFAVTIERSETCLLFRVIATLSKAPFCWRFLVKCDVVPHASLSRALSCIAGRKAYPESRLGDRISFVLNKIDNCSKRYIVPSAPSLPNLIHSGEATFIVLGQMKREQRNCGKITRLPRLESILGQESPSRTAAQPICALSEMSREVEGVILLFSYRFVQNRCIGTTTPFTNNGSATGNAPGTRHQVSGRGR